MRVYPSCACTFPSALARERARTCVRMRVFSHAGGLARRKPRFCNGCIPRLSPAPPGNQTPLIYTHKFTEYPSVYPKPRPTHLLVDRFRLHFPHACIPCAHTTLVPACSTAHTPSTHPSCIHAGVCVRERKRRTHTHTRARAHTHAHTHTHTHAHTHTRTRARTNMRTHAQPQTRTEDRFLSSDFPAKTDTPISPPSRSHPYTHTHILSLSLSLSLSKKLIPPSAPLRDQTNLPSASSTQTFFPAHASLPSTLPPSIPAT